MHTAGHRVKKKKKKKKVIHPHIENISWLNTFFFSFFFHSWAGVRSSFFRTWQRLNAERARSVEHLFKALVSVRQERGHVFLLLVHLDTFILIVKEFIQNAQPGVLVEGKGFLKFINFPQIPFSLLFVTDCETSQCLRNHVVKSGLHERWCILWSCLRSRELSINWKRC